MHFLRRSLLAVAAAALCCGAAFADSGYPNQPIHVIIPYPAGGLTDVQIRTISESMSKTLGQPIIVENKAGASAGIGTAFTARSAPDGYTLVFENNGFLINPYLNKQAGYDPVKDLTPVALVSTSPMVLVVNNEVPAKNVREFIAYAKKQTKGVEYGTAGTTSFGHMATELFAQQAGLNMTQIPYKGEAPMTLALRSGEVKTLITTPSPTMMGAVKDGKLRLLGVASQGPAPLLPGVEVISDVVPGYTAEVWFGLFAPAGTPPDVVAKINQAVAKAVALPEVKQKFAAFGAVAMTNPSATFAQAVKSEYARWGDVIQKAGLKAE